MSQLCRISACLMVSVISRELAAFLSVHDTKRQCFGTLRQEEMCLLASPYYNKTPEAAQKEESFTLTHSFRHFGLCSISSGEPVLRQAIMARSIWYEVN